MPQKENIGMNKNSKISGNKNRNNKNRNNKNSSSKNSRENSGNEKKELVWEDEWFRADLDKCGIRLLAKTEESRTALASLVREGGVENHYQAVVSGFMPDMEGQLSGTDPDGGEVLIDYEVLDELDTDEGPLSLVLFLAGPGQESEIRRSAESAGVRVKRGGLYSTRLTFTHPFTGEDVFLHREPEGRAFEMIDQMDWGT